MLYVPIVHGTHMGHETGFVRWTKRGDRLVPDYRALQRLMDLYEKHCGRPRIVCLIVWKPQYGSHAKFRGAQVKDREPIVITTLDPETGRMSAAEAPMFGKRGSEDFWKTAIQGARAVVNSRWKDSEVMLGQGFDSRPVKETVDFFNRVAPEMRWVVFSHWVRDPRPENGRLVINDGMEVGFRQQAAGGVVPELQPDYPDVARPQFFIAGSHRMDIVANSSPTSFRNVVCDTGSLIRNGLDFWKVREDDRGRIRPIFRSGICGAWLYRGNPVAITAPGPDGAANTVRFQMLREGVQETEARIFLHSRRHTLPETQRKQLNSLLNERAAAWRVARALTEAQLSLDWLGLTAREYAAAAELAEERTVGNWRKPPAVQPR